MWETQNAQILNLISANFAICQKVVFCTICPLSPGLLSGHGREAGVGGEKDEAGLDPFPCHTPTDCRPGTASGVWSCCTPANSLGRRRGPRRRQRRPAAARAAAAGAECARLQLLQFLFKRVHRPAGGRILHRGPRGLQFTRRCNTSLRNIRAIKTFPNQVRDRRLIAHFRFQTLQTYFVFFFFWILKYDITVLCISVPECTKYHIVSFLTTMSRTFIFQNNIKALHFFKPGRGNSTQQEILEMTFYPQIQNSPGAFWFFLQLHFWCSSFQTAAAVKLQQLSRWKCSCCNCRSSCFCVSPTAWKCI